MKKRMIFAIGILFINNLMAGDKEDLIEQIKQQWIDFSNKKANLYQSVQ